VEPSCFPAPKQCNKRNRFKSYVRVAEQKTTNGGTFQFGNTSTSAGSLFSMASGITLDRITTVYNTNLLLKSAITVNQLALYPESSIGLNGNAIRLMAKGPGKYTFPVGNGSGVAIPVTVQLESGTFAAGATVELKTSGEHPANNSTTHYLRKTWTVNTNGITNPVYHVTATYDPADVAGS
jgi:hypothetical protein